MTEKLVMAWCTPYMMQLHYHDMVGSLCNKVFGYPHSNNRPPLSPRNNPPPYSLEVQKTRMSKSAIIYSPFVLADICHILHLVVIYIQPTPNRFVDFHTNLY